ncbi:amidase [Prosthecomicrobium sp. N25]|uniref:amidase n=1 Tax=Prosthecomicrobium sp. N25 TaxID=3129254 RepID=UPI0030787697
MRSSARASSGPATDPVPDATALAEDLAARRVSAEAVLDRHLARIDRLEPALLAFLTLDRDGARAAARALDRAAHPVGPLHGLPVAVKDLTDTAGLRTTRGSLLDAERVPEADDPVVARLRRAGAVVIGKTNTPEFGFGAVCTNALRGPTANPYDLRLTSGGSSGGSAVAVASGMAALAHGTDFGGSVRTPAGFCCVVSIRPTPGLVGDAARDLAWTGLATHGALARTVDDAALLLRAMASDDPLDPLSAGARAPGPPPAAFPRVAATADFGIATMAREVRDRFDEAVAAAEPVLGPIPRSTPDCAGAGQAFRVLRAAQVARTYGPLADRHSDRLSPTVRWNVEAGRSLSAQDYLAAEATRAALWRRFCAFFREVDVLIAPSAAVMPWPSADGEVLAIDGTPLPDILDYLTVTFVVSLVGFPVVTLPAPRRAHPLPFGLQLIGPPGGEEALIAVARRLEREAGFAWRPPPVQDLPPDGEACDHP